VCNNPFEEDLSPRCGGDCGKPKELAYGHQDGSFEGFDLENIHGMFNVKMPPGKGMPAAKGGGRNDIKGVYS
jgi:hypothetical protein